MPGLLSIAPLAQTVNVRGQEIPVPGISAEGIVYLLESFPELRALIAGKSTNLTPEAVLQRVPKAVAAIIAAGTGAPGNVKAEAVAASLPAGDQLALLEPIIKNTMPEGLGPFVDRLAALAALTSGGLTKAPATS